MNPIRSTIDLGTNTCLLLVVECEGSGSIKRVIHDQSTLVRLGQGVDRARELQPEAMSRTLDCLRTYAKKVRELGGEPAKTVAVGTSASRDARNGSQFYAQVEKETGFRFQVISGEEEARLTFLGALPEGADPEHAAVLDIGGGSTEIIRLGGSRSIDIGSVRLTERYFKSNPVTDEEFWSCQSAIDEALEEARASVPKADQLIAVAGTATTIAALYLGLSHFDAQAINALEIHRGDVHRWVEDLKWRSIEERRALPGMEAGREDVLLAGALILWRVLELWGYTGFRVSTRGLRYGLLSI